MDSLTNCLPERCHERVQVKFHCSVGASIINVYDVAYLLCINWCVVLLCLWGIKSPDSANLIAAVTVDPMMKQPNTQHTPFERFDGVGISFGCFMYKRGWEFECHFFTPHVISSVIVSKIMKAKMNTVVIRQSNDLDMLQCLGHTVHSQV